LIERSFVGICRNMGMGIGIGMEKEKGIQGKE
jgi:hypothetical protein